MGSDFRSRKYWENVSFAVFLSSDTLDLTVDTYARYAEMEPAEKNALSHRYKALSKLKEHLRASGTGA